MNTSPSQAGFSLIELVAVVTITAIVSIVSVSVLVNSQVRSTKATTIAKVRQEGQFAVQEISYLLRNAKYLLPNQFGQTCAENMGALRVATKDDSVVEIYTDDSLRIASNSGTVITDPPAAYLTSPSVNVTGAITFNCQQEPYQTGALVDFHFTLNTGDAENVSAENYYSQDFSDQVYIRSYQ